MRAGISGGGSGRGHPAAHSVVLRDTLAHARDKAATVFVGRLPRRTEVSLIYQWFSAAGFVPAQVIPSKETYLFVELVSPAAAEAACKLLNGSSLLGTSVMVIPATSLKKLFIGNIDRLVDASMLHRAVASVSPGLLFIELFEESGASTVRMTGAPPDAAQLPSGELHPHAGAATAFTGNGPNKGVHR